MHHHAATPWLGRRWSVYRAQESNCLVPSGLFLSSRPSWPWKDSRSLVPYESPLQCQESVGNVGYCTQSNWDSEPAQWVWPHHLLEGYNWCVGREIPGMRSLRLYGGCWSKGRQHPSWPAGHEVDSHSLSLSLPLSHSLAPSHFLSLSLPLYLFLRHTLFLFPDTVTQTENYVREKEGKEVIKREQPGRSGAREEEREMQVKSAKRKITRS